MRRTSSPNRLAELPPAKWAEAKARMAVVDRFIAEGDPSTAAIRRAAAEIGVSRSMFYQLLKQWNPEGRSDAVRLPGPHREQDAAQADLVNEALAICGPGATQARVAACAMRIAEHRGLRAPTRSRLRRLHMRSGAGADIAERLGLAEWTTVDGLRASHVVDAATLALRVAVPHETPKFATLTVAVDLVSGEPSAWRADAGHASPARIADLVVRASRSRPGAVVLSSAFPAPVAKSIAALSEVDVPAARLKRGAAISAAFGSRIARIGLLPRGVPKSGGGDLPVVLMDDLASVLGVMLP